MTAVWILMLFGAGGVVLLALLRRSMSRRGASGRGFRGQSGDVRRLRIRVKGGYEPDLVEIDHAVPVVLEFQREESDPCSERVILDGFDRNVYLRAHEITEVRLVPERPGTFDFACGMGTLKGRILVRDARASAERVADHSERG